MKTTEQFMTKSIVVWIGAMICCALWGSAFPCIKIGYRLMQIGAGDTASQILYAGCRFTLAGILIDLRPVHPENTSTLINFNLDGRTIFSRLVQPIKALAPIVNTVKLISTLVNEVQFSNALAAICFTLTGNVIDVNASFP